MARLKTKAKKDFFGFLLGDSLEKGGRRKASSDVLSKAERWGVKEQSVEKGTRPSTWRLVPVYLLIFGSFILILGRSFDLQIIKGASFFGSAQGNRMRVVVDHAPRGAVFDRNGNVLAENIPGYRLVLDSSLVARDKRSDLIDRLSKILGEKLDKKKIFDSKESQITLKTDLSNEKALSVQAQENDLPGVSLEISPIRSYPEKDLTSHIIGYTSQADKDDLAKKIAIPYGLGDQVGKFGVEQGLESVLRGVNGYKLISTDASGRKSGEVYESKSIPGRSVYLSIDLDLQRVVKDSLQKWMSTKGARGGSAVALDPNTGQILAMVSLPSFDNNLFAKGISESDYSRLISDPSKRLLNRSISASYPPGSTFKMVTSVAGLESGAINPDTKIDDPGFINLGGIIFNNWYWTDHHKTEGSINVARALARSTDTFFYQVGERTGEKAIQSWAQTFGLGKKTGVNIPGEEAGLVPTEKWKREVKGEPWYPGDTLNISIGQGDLLATPMQMSLVTVVFANGGKLLTPTLLRDSSPQVVKQNFLKKDTIDIVRDGLYQDTIGDGNVGWLFGNFKIQTAGKTGSAESGNGAPHAWYTAFAPFNPPAGGPRLVVTVQVEDAGHGSEISAPAVKDIFSWFFSNR